MNRNYVGIFENWEVRVARKIITQMKKEWNCLKYEQDEDLLQECLIHWFYAKDSYSADDGRASAKTYMAKVIKNKMMNIVKAKNSNKRKVMQKSVSLTMPVSCDNEEFVLEDTISDEKNNAVRIRLQVDCSLVLKQLSDKQRVICEMIMKGEENMSDVSKMIGIGRATLYREIKRIRRIFESAGLKDFFHK